MKQPCFCYIEVNFSIDRKTFYARTCMKKLLINDRVNVCEGEKKILDGLLFKKENFYLFFYF